MSRVHFLPESQLRGGLLQWVIGIMVFLSGMAIVAGLQLGSLAEDWRSSAESSLTVQIVEADNESREVQIEAALEVLRGMPGVAAAQLMDDDTIADLLEPWIGQTDLTSQLPLPAMIDVTLQPGISMDMDALRTLLADAAPAARLDTHEQWLGDLVSLSLAAQLISAAVIAMMAVATIAIVVFTTRASLMAQQETVDVVHMLGASDATIAGAFQRRLWVVGLRGGLLGLLQIGLVFVGFYALSLNIQSVYLPSFSPDPMMLATLCLLPLLTGLLTMATARMTVRRALMALV